MTTSDIIVYNFDGGGGGDNGPCGWGWVNNVGDEECGALAPGSTSNQAEYTALTMAIRHASVICRDFGYETFRFQGDSKLVVEQVNGRWAVHANKLRPLVSTAQMLLNGLPHWSLTWIPRKENARADEMAWKGKTLWVPGQVIPGQTQAFPRGWAQPV